MRPALAFAAAAATLATAAFAEPAKPAERKRAAKPERAPKLEPYDPDRVRAGRTPGFIDLGNGTEVRVSGRVRMDYDGRGR